MQMKLLIAGAMFAASAVVAPVAASASLSQCDTNYMCVYGNDNYEWLIAKQYHGNSNWVDPFGGDEDSNDQSYANYSGTYTGCLADNLNGGGDRVTIPTGGRDPNLAVWNDNQASSMRTASGC